MTTPLILAKNLTKTFLTPFPLSILKGIDLAIFEQEAVALLGKSGEGKSTLLHILGSLEKSSSGILELYGKKIQDHNLPYLRNHKIGFIFQNAHLLENETLLNNTLIPAKIGRLDTSCSSFLFQRAIDLLESVGLGHRLHSPCNLLSGGEKQRAAIARALLLDPPLILADEPSGNLDSIHSQSIQDLLITCVKQDKKTLLVATHDADFAARCDRILCLKDGLLSPLPSRIVP